MGTPTGLRCIRCGARYGAGEKLFKGCPTCLAQEHPANLYVEYDYPAIKGSFDPRKLQGRPNTMWRYHELLPVELEQAVSMGALGPRKLSRNETRLARTEWELPEAEYPSSEV